MASSSGDTTVKLWKRDGMSLKTLTDHKAAVWGIAFSPDLTGVNLNEADLVGAVMPSGTSHNWVTWGSGQ